MDTTKAEKNCVSSAQRLENTEMPLSKADIKAIKEYVNNEFDPDEPDNHCALCNGCYFLLNKKRNVYDAIIKINERYKSEGTPKFLRSTGPN